jgi:cyclophilin family peptidyl-prolyl cis-trans isomerase
MLSPAIASAASVLDPQNTLIMDTTKGRVVIQLRPDLAPNHVARVKTLTKQGFYNGTPFHRVVQDFMAQGGDPTGTGMGGSPLPDLKAEFTNANFAVIHLLQGLLVSQRSVHALGTGGKGNGRRRPVQEGAGRRADRRSRQDHQDADRG